MRNILNFIIFVLYINQIINISIITSEAIELKNFPSVVGISLPTVPNLLVIEKQAKHYEVVSSQVKVDKV